MNSTSRVLILCEMKTKQQTNKKTVDDRRIKQAANLFKKNHTKSPPQQKSVSNQKIFLILIDKTNFSLRKQKS